MNLAHSLADRLGRVWWQDHPTWTARALQPLARLLQQVAQWDRRRQLGRHGLPTLRAPVIVVGNLIVGGAGKTPTVIALVAALRELGWRPGVVSRGHGRQGDERVEVTAQTPASLSGDEPLLIHLRTGAPVTVGRDRVAAAQQLLASHPEVDVLISDDGLQHWRLPRQLQVLVFDGRGVGNGLTLPAGPLRQALPAQVPADTLVLYNADHPSTPLPGSLALRRLGGVLPLDRWWSGDRPDPQAWAELVEHARTQPVLAAAGMGQPERFFGMLEAAGLCIRRCPLPDHADLGTLPWPARTPDVVLTEKDAVKLHPHQCPGTRVWVVALDFQLPDDFRHALALALAPLAARQKNTP